MAWICFRSGSVCPGPKPINYLDQTERERQLAHLQTPALYRIHPCDSSLRFAPEPLEYDWISVLRSDSHQAPKDVTYEVR